MRVSRNHRNIFSSFFLLLDPITPRNAPAMHFLRRVFSPVLFLDLIIPRNPSASAMRFHRRAFSPAVFANSRSNYFARTAPTRCRTIFFATALVRFNFTIANPRENGEIPYSTGARVYFRDGNNGNIKTISRFTCLPRRTIDY